MNVQIGPFSEKENGAERAPINISIGTFLPEHRFKDHSPKGIKNAIKRSLISFVIGGNALAGYVVGKSISHQTEDNSAFITGYIKTINDCSNLGLSIGYSSIEIGESGITLAKEAGPNSLYINLSDEIYIGLSTTVIKDNNAITNYGELYVNLPALAFAAVSLFCGSNSMPAYSTGAGF